jgi:hypothetical protein
MLILMRLNKQGVTMRHKFMTRLEIDDYDEFFKDLKDKGYVVKEYEYTRPTQKALKRNIESGAVLLVKDHGQVFYSIATNTGWKHKRYSRVKQTTTGSYVNTRTMYQLTNEGVQYIKECIVEQRI